MEAVNRLVLDKSNATGFTWGPEAVHIDEGDRVFKEIWTANWWHITQVCETHGAGKVTTTYYRDLTTSQPRMIRDTNKEPRYQKCEGNNITITRYKTHFCMTMTLKEYPCSNLCKKEMYDQVSS